MIFQFHPFLKRVLRIIVDATLVHFLNFKIPLAKFEEKEPVRLIVGSLKKFHLLTQ